MRKIILLSLFFLPLMGFSQEDSVEVQNDFPNVTNMLNATQIEFDSSDVLYPKLIEINGKNFMLFTYEQAQNIDMSKEFEGIYKDLNETNEELNIINITLIKGLKSEIISLKESNSNLIEQNKKGEKTIADLKKIERQRVSELEIVEEQRVNDSIKIESLTKSLTKQKLKTIGAVIGGAIVSAGTIALSIFVATR